MDTASSPVLELLAAERAALAAAVARVPEPLRTRSPAPDRWSVAQVLEHLVRVEKGIARLFEVRGREVPPAPLPDGVTLERARLTPALIARLRDREERLEAPERIRPAGTAGAEEAWQALEAMRRQLLAAYAAAEPAALDGAVHAHAVLGPLVLRDWLEFAAHHEARHRRQIEEIAAALAASAPGEAADDARPVAR